MDFTVREKTEEKRKEGNRGNDEDVDDGHSEVSHRHGENAKDNPSSGQSCFPTSPLLS